VDGSTVALSRQGRALPSLPLDADSGALPLLWLVNGKRIESAPFRRQAEWQPDGPGAVRITVIDGACRVASSEAWLQ
jgi:penicillin-binding protein 1C